MGDDGCEEANRMQAALVTPTHAPAVQDVLGADAHIQEVQQGDGSAALGEVARLPVDTLVLDVGTGPALGPAVVRYRMARPTTRIVILAIGRQPGDADVAALVTAGIYDICAEASMLAAVLAVDPGTLANAVAWLPRGLSPEATEPRVVTRTVERVVERERLIEAPMATHPAVIAVVGLDRCCGATITASALAGWLVRRRQGVLLAGQDPVLLREAMEQKEPTDLEELHPAMVQPSASLSLAALPAWALARRRWPWVVVDAGPVTGGGETWVWPEASRDADVVVLVLPREYWRFIARGRQWHLDTRAGALAGTWGCNARIRVATWWQPKDGKAKLADYGHALTGDSDYRVLPVPDMTATMAAGWPLGGLVADVALDRAVHAMLSPLVDHLMASRGAR